MAFDITNPATYSKDFKNLLRQKGYAGKKDVPVEELEALYVDYSGKQEQDTKVATNLLSSVAADPAPYTGAMASQDTFQGDQSFDLTQINNQGGSGPIFSTVQAVDEQAALRRQQSEQAAAQPDPNDQFRMVVQDRILPAIDAIMEFEKEFNIAIPDDQAEKIVGSRHQEYVGAEDAAGQCGPACRHEDQ
jgi:hypothetical protein